MRIFRHQKRRDRNRNRETALTGSFFILPENIDNRATKCLDIGVSVA